MIRVRESDSFRSVWNTLIYIRGTAKVPVFLFHRWFLAYSFEGASVWIDSATAFVAFLPFCS